MALAETNDDARAFGIYVHIPFCKQVCRYCDFNVRKLPRQAPWDALGAALDIEVQRRSAAFPKRVTSIYFGGGTPSLAPPAFIAQRLEAIHAHYSVADGCEITLEADPNTIDAQGLVALQQSGITRLSLGWQSTHASLLKLLGRQHTALQAQQLIYDARSAGFDNINIDLIYAVPTQTLDQLEDDLAALELVAPEHVSLYSLTYAPRVPLTRMVSRKELAKVSEALEQTMGERIVAALSSMGLDRYEVSNFARPNKQSRHNLGYWSGAPYLGVGPGAHSFLPRSPQLKSAHRWENVRGVKAYIDAFAPTSTQQHTTPPGKASQTITFVESLSETQRAYERVLLGLRQPLGLKITPLLTTLPQLEHKAQQLVVQGLATWRDDWLVPTVRGLDCADAAATFCAGD